MRNHMQGLLADEMLKGSVNSSSVVAADPDTRGSFTFGKKQPPASDLKLCSQKQCAPQDRIQIQYVILIEIRAGLALVADIQNASREFKLIKAKSISPVKRNIVPYPPSDAFSSGGVPERRNRVRVPLHGQVVVAGAEQNMNTVARNISGLHFPPMRLS